MSDSRFPDRYSRQVRFTPIGEAGQHRLAQARVAVVGCGALGTVSVSGLVRAGVGTVRIIDRDIVEASNLQRQILFDEPDAQAGLPKAEAAARKLRQINSDVVIEPIVADVHAQNIHQLLDDVDLIIDGSDNFEVRFLINDFCHQSRKPWVYGGAVGATGQSMTIVPGETPCLACLIETVPPPGTLPTCETAGIIAPASMIIGSVQVAEALKILSGNIREIARGLLVVDVWSGRFRRVSLDRLRANADCPTCTGQSYPWLEGTRGSQSAALCGRMAVQVVPEPGTSIDWHRLREKLKKDFDVEETPFLTRFHVEDLELSVFRDGRAIIKGTDDLARARSVYAKYLGS